MFKLVTNHNPLNPEENAVINKKYNSRIQISALSTEIWPKNFQDFKSL